MENKWISSKNNNLNHEPENAIKTDVLDSQEQVDIDIPINRNNDDLRIVESSLETLNVNDGMTENIEQI